MFPWETHLDYTERTTPVRVDVQCHAFPKAYADFLLKHGKDFKAMRVPGKYLFDFNGNQFLAMADEEYDPATILASMDRARIDLSLISCTLPDPGLRRWSLLPKPRRWQTTRWLS